MIPNHIVTKSRKLSSTFFVAYKRKLNKSESTKYYRDKFLKIQNEYDLNLIKMHENEDLAEEQADKIVYFKALDCQYYNVPKFHFTCRPPQVVLRSPVHVSDR